MRELLKLSDINIRTELRSGDIGYMIYMHGVWYAMEYNYGITFESYVAAGMHEFYDNYNPEKDRVWICEYHEKMIGSLVLMDRGDSAQLRYFLIHPEFRGIGLGKKLMELYMSRLRSVGYQSSYLWTTNELLAAASLYTRHGFALTEQKPWTSIGEHVDQQRYDLKL